MQGRSATLAPQRFAAGNEVAVEFAPNEMQCSQEE
jgi:hypothetical protein